MKPTGGVTHLATSGASLPLCLAQIYLFSTRAQTHSFFCFHAFICAGYYLVFFTVSYCLSISDTPPTTASQYF